MLGQGFTLGEQALGEFSFTSLAASTSLASSAQIIANAIFLPRASVVFASQANIVAALEFKNKLNMLNSWQSAANILASATYRYRITSTLTPGASLLANLQSKFTLSSRTAVWAGSISLISSALIYTNIRAGFNASNAANFGGNLAILRASRARPRSGNVSGVVSTEVPWLSLVVREDPSWARLKYDEIEYEFSGRTLRANPYARGSYKGNLAVAPLDTYHSSIVTGLQGPDWQYNASKMIEAADTNYHLASLPSTRTGADIPYVFYGDFKYAGRHVLLSVQGDNGDNNFGVDVNLFTGDVMSTSVTNSASLDSVSVSKQSNGYWRICIAGTVDSPTISAYALFGTSNADVGGDDFYLGDGVSGVLAANLHFRETE